MLIHIAQGIAHHNDITCSSCFMYLLPSFQGSKMNPMMGSSLFMCSCVRRDGQVGRARSWAVPTRWWGVLPRSTPSHSLFIFLSLSLYFSLFSTNLLYRSKIMLCNIFFLRATVINRTIMNTFFRVTRGNNTTSGSNFTGRWWRNHPNETDPEML
jgi:hypothetical protein